MHKNEGQTSNVKFASNVKRVKAKWCHWWCAGAPGRLLYFRARARRSCASRARVWGTTIIILELQNFIYNGIGFTFFQSYFWNRCHSIYITHLLCDYLQRVSIKRLGGKPDKNRELQNFCHETSHSRLRPIISPLRQTPGSTDEQYSGASMLKVVTWVKYSKRSNVTQIH